MSHLLVLRPQPGADETVARARALGLTATAAPIFSVGEVAWAPPAPEDFDALLVTSANALRHAGPALAGFTSLPCYAVGEATAKTARAAGFTNVTAGASDAEALLDLVAADGRTRLLHLCGREHRQTGRPGLSITRRIVYAAEPASVLPAEASEALQANAVALLHSPRAGALFGQLVDTVRMHRNAIRLAAISDAAASAAGSGWRCLAVASAPSDEALLECAAKLCKTEGA
jgi:uroporphyrinogen-III synthase